MKQPITYETPIDFHHQLLVICSLGQDNTREHEVQVIQQGDKFYLAYLFGDYEPFAKVLLEGDLFTCYMHLAEKILEYYVEEFNDSLKTLKETIEIEAKSFSISKGIPPEKCKEFVDNLNKFLTCDVPFEHYTKVKLIRKLIDQYIDQYQIP